MEDVFNKLKSQGKNTVDGIIQWLKDANVIEEDSNTLTKEELERTFSGVENVDYESFKETLDKLRDSHKEEDDFANKVSAQASKMEEAFENLKKQGKNDVDNLVSWLKQSNLMGTAKDAEQKVRKIFENVDAKNVEYTKFKEAVSKIAEEQKKTVEELTKTLEETVPKLTKTLEETVPKLTDALQAGASAFKDALTKKK